MTVYRLLGVMTQAVALAAVGVLAWIVMALLALIMWIEDNSGI